VVQFGGAGFAQGGARTLFIVGVWTRMLFIGGIWTGRCLMSASGRGCGRGLMSARGQAAILLTRTAALVFVTAAVAGNAAVGSALC
jgi:hypothetical protein